MFGEPLLLGGVEGDMFQVAGILNLVTDALRLLVDFIAGAAAQGANPGFDLTGTAHPDGAVRFFMLF